MYVLFLCFYGNFGLQYLQKLCLFLLLYITNANRKMFIKLTLLVVSSFGKKTKCIFFCQRIDFCGKSHNSALMKLYRELIHFSSVTSVAKILGIFLEEIDIYRV